VVPMLYGITLTTRNPGGPTSAKAGVNQVFVNPQLGARRTATTVAHELRAHALRYLLGYRFLHELRMTGSGSQYFATWDPKGPVNREGWAAEAEALRNFDPFLSPD